MVMSFDLEKKSGRGSDAYVSFIVKILSIEWSLEIYVFLHAERRWGYRWFALCERRNDENSQQLKVPQLF